MSKATTLPTEKIALPGQWTTEVAYAAANMAQEVAGRLTAVLVLIDHLQNPDPDFLEVDGWTLATVRDLVQSCQVDLCESVTAEGAR